MSKAPRQTQSQHSTQRGRGGGAHAHWRIRFQAASPAPLRAHAGPKERLDDTTFAQPLMFVGGLAAVELLRSRWVQLGLVDCGWGRWGGELWSC